MSVRPGSFVCAPEHAIIVIVFRGCASFRVKGSRVVFFFFLSSCEGIHKDLEGGDLVVSLGLRVGSRKQE